MNFIETVSVNF